MFTLFLSVVFGITGFLIGLFVGLAQKIDKAKIEIEANVQDILESQKRILTYTGEKRLNIDYRDANGEKTNRNIVVKYIYDDKGKTYIRAFCLLRNEMRNFRLDNIIKICIDGAEISEPENYFRDKIKAE